MHTPDYHIFNRSDKRIFFFLIIPLQNVWMGFTTHSVAVYVVLVLMAMCVKKSEDTAKMAACKIIRNLCVKVSTYTNKKQKRDRESVTNL